MSSYLSYADNNSLTIVTLKRYFYNFSFMSNGFKNYGIINQSGKYLKDLSFFLNMNVILWYNI